MEDKEDFTFSIEGKDYTISEKKNTQKKSNKQTLHVPSLGIGAIIAGICIVGIFFGLGDFSESNEPLIERQLTKESKESIEPSSVTVDTFIQNGSPMLGNPNAPITLIEFGDYQCHYCNVYYHNIEHKIFEDYVITGKVNVVFKDFTIIGQDSISAAHAAHCASDQGMYWKYHDILYDNWNGENNGWINPDSLAKFAQQIDLDMEEFVDCNVNGKHSQRISISNGDAQALGITGTPAFFIISINSNQVQTISGAQPYEVFERIFNSMLEN